MDEPIALTPEFSANPQKQAQWAGFIRRMKLHDVPSLPEIVDQLREFLMPAMRAAAMREDWHSKWLASGGKWYD